MRAVVACKGDATCFDQSEVGALLQLGSPDHRTLNPRGPNALDASGSRKEGKLPAPSFSPTSPSSPSMSTSKSSGAANRIAGQQCCWGPQCDNCYDADDWCSWSQENCWTCTAG